MRIPKHIGIIPDGNRRWAKRAGLEKKDGYAHGLAPGLELLRLAKQAGVQEITYYGFTTDNCGRPPEQVQAFSNACTDAVKLIAAEGVSLLVVGDQDAPAFPRELLPYTTRTDLNGGGIRVNFLVNYKLIAAEGVSLLVVGDQDAPAFPRELLPYTTRTDLNGGGIRVNFLVNYGWEWDLAQLSAPGTRRDNICGQLRSRDISRVELLIRWGGMRRLSGFLPVQSVYADFYVVDRLWPDFRPEDFYQALAWYQKQDVTLGG